jgi:hypothetical protein
MIAVIVGRVAVDAGSADSDLEATASRGATEAKEPFSGESPL